MSGTRTLEESQLKHTHEQGCHGRLVGEYQPSCMWCVEERGARRVLEEQRATYASRRQLKAQLKAPIHAQLKRERDEARLAEKTWRGRAERLRRALEEIADGESDPDCHARRALNEKEET